MVTAPVSKWRKNQQANFGGNRWNDQKPVRTRDASVDVRPEWVVKGQITFQELQKLTMEVPEGTELYTCGSVAHYESALYVDAVLTNWMAWTRPGEG